MVSILITHKVADFAVWKKAYDSNIGLRTSHGELSSQIFRDVSDPSKLTVINKWDTLENAQKFVQSPELKAAMERSGVTSQPAFTYQNEA